MFIMQQLKVQFPLGGLNRSAAYRAQPPHSTPDCLNVRPTASIESRNRGGSRPGLMQSHITQLDGPVRLLAQMTLPLGDNFTSFIDGFSGLSLASAWGQAAWSENLPSILTAFTSASVDTDTAEGAAVLDELTIDTAEPYTVEALLVPWDGSFSGKYRVYCRLDDTSPDITEDGVEVELVMDDAVGTYSGHIKSYVAGTPTTYSITEAEIGTSDPGWLTVHVDGNTITVYWQGTQIKQQAVSANSGTRVGFALECTEDGGLCLCNVFRVQYYSTASEDVTRTILVASADGKLYRETFDGIFEQVSTNATLRDDVQLTATQSGTDLYIADYGDVAAEDTDGSVSGTTFDATGVDDWTALGISKYDHVVVIDNVDGTATAGAYAISSIAAGSITLATDAGTGNCAYRIERALKVYSPIDGTLEIVTATDGQVPIGCPLVCRYLDRIVLAGTELAPNAYYMSRVADPLDWDYSQTDSQRAYLGGSGEAGVPGSAIRSTVPHTDDYLVIGCMHELWMLRGDPTYGGSLDSISRVSGIIDQDAWCIGPNGEVVFLALDGVYMLPPGGNAVPQSMSREQVPKEFRRINPNTITVSMAYDSSDRGVNIFLTPESSNDRVHWWIDWETKTFWPMTLNADHEPTAVCSVQSYTPEDSFVILGCRDGYMRRFSGFSSTDCGEEIESYVFIGPLPIADDDVAGRVNSIMAVLASGSGDVTWEIRTANTPEAAITATALATGTWTEGINAAEHPAGHGQAMTVKVTGDGLAWALEYIVASIWDGQPLRIL